MLKSGRVPNYIFKSAQLENDLPKGSMMMQNVLDRILESARDKRRDVMDSAKGRTEYHIVESYASLNEVEKNIISNYLSQFGNIDSDLSLSRVFKSYLQSEFNELPDYPDDGKDYFEQLADRLIEENVGSCEVLEISDKTAVVRDDEIYLGFEYIVFKSAQSLEDEFLGL